MKTNEELRAENEAIRAMLATGPADQLLAIPGVVHVSVGLKETAGQVTDQLCIRVYVKHKKDTNELSPAELIPPDINGVPTDVNVIPEFEFQDDTGNYRPIRGGSQISNRIVVLNEEGNGRMIHRGTLGCIAIDTTDDAPVILTNWHVIGDPGRAGDKIYQPAPTAVPLVQLGDLPARPTDEVDKVGVLRRKEISSTCDGAIAAIDVSSCCNCCGIECTNEIVGLSKDNHPPLNTIVGDEKATGGMVVYKVGQSSGRTEGRVIDDNYPKFDIKKDGTTYSFTNQIAIQHVNPNKPFSVHGDSGSVIINEQNKIVGLLFASGKNVEVKGVVRPLVTIANHISDVLTELKIRIPYSAEVFVIAGQTLTDVPTTFEAPVPEPYRVLRERLQQNDVTAKLFAIGKRHREEVTYLVNHCRPVTVAWRRAEGPALLATIMGAVRDGHYQLPASIRGITPPELLERMRVALGQHGSAALKETMNSLEVDWKELFASCDNLHDLIERIARDRQVVSLLERVSQ